MPAANFAIGQTFPLQFAWRLPSGDYLRAVYDAEILDLVPEADKYMVRLLRLRAGRQEDADGNLREQAEYTAAYWRLAGELAGRKITVAYEADDGRALHMRLATLTGEHNFFSRYESAEAVARALEAAARRKATEEQRQEGDPPLQPE